MVQAPTRRDGHVPVISPRFGGMWPPDVASASGSADAYIIDQTISIATVNGDQMKRDV